jgi:hypothetical protein
MGRLVRRPLHIAHYVRRTRRRFSPAITIPRPEKKRPELLNLKFETFGTGRSTEKDIEDENMIYCAASTVRLANFCRKKETHANDIKLRKLCNQRKYKHHSYKSCWRRKDEHL